MNKLLQHCYNELSNTFIPVHTRNPYARLEKGTWMVGSEAVRATNHKSTLKEI